MQRLPTIDIQCGLSFLNRLLSQCNKNPVLSTVINGQVPEHQISSRCGEIEFVFIPFCREDFFVKIDDCVVIKFPVYYNRWWALGE